MVSEQDIITYDDKHRNLLSCKDVMVRSIEVKIYILRDLELTRNDQKMFIIGLSLFVLDVTMDEIKLGKGYSRSTNMFPEDKTLNWDCNKTMNEIFKDIFALENSTKGLKPDQFLEKENINSNIRHSYAEKINQLSI
eukprot:snap_masked-scaffold_2-processed-gene-11.19-mRNA-1 protein AED:1.00 eAED:1.00 QI:0/0/0/0/1/1/2/0/136